MVTPALQTEWAPGARVRLAGEAGSGGSAVVMDAATPSGARVALKIGHAADVAPLLAAEARLVAVTEHAGMPRAHWCGWVRRDAGDALVVGRDTPGALPALAMEWVEGAPLGDAAIDELEALAVTRDLASTLAALHAAGWAHGDVSLANVLVDAGGRARLVDAGLAAPIGLRDPRGGTLRYLDLAAGGDARTRDLAALGAFVAELARPSLRHRTALLEEARSWASAGEGVLAAIAAPLLSPSPSSRPRAAWASERAEAERVARGCASAPRGPSRSAEVRAAYLRLRREDLAAATPGEAQPTWLRDAMRRLDEAAAMEGTPPVHRPAMAPLDALAISRWLIALVGPAAAEWPVARLMTAGERRLEYGLVGLAHHQAPSGWTFDRVEHAVLGGHAIAAAPERAAMSPGEDVARLAFALAGVPADAAAIEAVEGDLRCPDALVLAAADALRRRGDAGRARALLRRVDAAAAAALAADVHRRAGDAPAAAAAATLARDCGDHTGRGRAVLGRLALDASDIAAARAHVAAADRAPLLEVLILAAAAEGDAPAARDAAARGRVLARSPEERARIAGALGYALAEVAPDEALVAFREAAEHAARAEAVEEEATYRTGEAATAVSEGRYQDAIATGRRAALLWDALGRSDRAARGMQACAAAYASVHLAPECDRWAAMAAERAREGGDARAELFAVLASIDVRRGGPDAAALATPAVARLGAGALAALGGDDATGRGDALRLLARGLDADVALAEEVVAAADVAARDGSLETGARLDWWGSRAAHVAVPPAAQVDEVLASLASLVAQGAAVDARGRAAAEGFALAAASGRTELAARLGAAARECARTIVDRAGVELAPAAREVPWIARWVDGGGAAGTAAAGLDAIGQDQARELLRIVRSLEGRERLGDLLDRIVDALVTWTGVERGLLLLPAPDGRLVPRAARRLGRADLEGDQLALSQTLARRALDAGEPVVAVDASGEMAEMHRSVHALRLRSVLAVPLVARGEVLGVVYLDDRVRRGAFGPRELAWARTVAALAATVLAEARERVLLRREARRARRAGEKLAVELARREAALEVAEQRLAEGRDRTGAFAAIVGDSPALLRVLRTAERVARSSVPVLVLGESGTGKELFARAIHDASPRARGPFIGENCSAIPETLLEATLFGHERGAFTGADRARVGLFDAAHGGTLFLDEIGEMSLGMQAKLLRVLEDGMVRAVGATRARRVDVRVIAATHRDLQAMVGSGAFREDLYYRLNIVVLPIPPLRERREDLPHLVRHFVTRHAEDRAVRVSRAAMDRLVAHDWPGNVRQVENEVRRALVLADEMIEPEHLTDEVAGRADALACGDASTMRGRIDALESALVREALEETGGNVTHAAKALGVSRFGLQKMVKRLGIERAAEAPPPPSGPRGAPTAAGRVGQGQSAPARRRAASTRSR